MNKQRMKELAALKLHETLLKLEDLENEEQEAYDNLPESLQGGEQGEKMQEWIDAMQEAQSGLDTLIGMLDDAS